MILRCQKALFCAYRTDQYADPEGFMVSLGAVLEQFPDEVITYVTSPRTGIQRRLKWPPTINEIVEACEEQIAYLDRLKRPRHIPEERSPPPRLREMPKGSLGNVFVPETHPRYRSVSEWAQTAEPVWWKVEASSDGRKGIWIPLSVWESPIASFK